MELIATPAFKSHIATLLEKHHIPGLSLAVVHNGNFSSAGFGKARLADKILSDSDAGVGNIEQDCTADTLFDIASCSKSLTAAAVGFLVEDDENFPQVKWDSKMSDLLPEDFVLEQEEYTRGVTLEDCLSHRTGLPSHDSSYLGISSTQPDTPESVTRNLRNLPLAKPIRSAYMYNNMFFTVVTHLIETVTDQTFAQFLQERIFGPLKLSSTYLQPSAVHSAGQAERMACGYRFGPPPPRPSKSNRPNNGSEEAREQSYHPISPANCPEAQGAGSILTSANDHITYLHALMHAHPPFTASLLTDLLTPRFALPSSDQASCDAQPYTSSTIIGLGWEIIYYRGVKVVMHDGWVNGFVSKQFFLPEEKFAGVVRCNGDGDGAFVVVQAICRELIDDVLGVEHGRRTDWVGWFEEWVKEEEGDKETREDVVRKLKGEEDDEYSLVRAVADVAIASSAAPSQTGDDLEQSKRKPIQKTELPPSLDLFTGSYHNPGYHTITVQLSPQRGEPDSSVLLIDASDRSMGFTITLELICWAPPDENPAQQEEVHHEKQNSKAARFLATLTDTDGCSTEYLEAEFVLEDDRERSGFRAVKLGIDLEEDLQGSIWFERLEE